MIKITLSEYNALPKEYRGVWTTERDDLPNWAEIRDKYMGKRTMLHSDNDATVLLVEGLGFEIIDEPTTDCEKPSEKDETLIEQIKNLLRVLGTKELNLENVEQPSMALWWDNKGAPNETMVLAVGVDDKNDLYLTLDDGCGGDVQIWESCGQLSENDLEPALENIRERMAERPNPDRVVITDDITEVIEMVTTPTANPEMFCRRVRSLMLSGLSKEEAEKFVASTPQKLELFYDVNLGAFAIDAEAVGNTPLYNPYTGKEIPDETE